MFAVSATKWLTSVSRRSWSLETQSSPILSTSAGMIDGQVGVACALAVAVHGPLHVHATGLDRDERVGHGAAGVVVRVDAERGRDARREISPTMRATSKRQHAAVRVAQHDGVGARLGRRRAHLDRVVGVRDVPVEEVLGVEEHRAPGGLEVGDALADHVEVLLERGVERLGHVEVPRLAHDAHRGAARCPAAPRARDLSSAVVSLRRVEPNADTTAPASFSSRDALEELDVLRVRARETRLRCSGCRDRRAARRCAACPRPRATCPSRWVPSRSVVS